MALLPLRLVVRVFELARVRAFAGGFEFDEARERAHILRVCEATGWQIKGAEGAARKLGLNPATLYSRMKKLGSRRPVER